MTRKTASVPAPGDDRHPSPSTPHLSAAGEESSRPSKSHDGPELVWPPQTGSLESFALESGQDGLPAPTWRDSPPAGAPIRVAREPQAETADVVWRDNRLLRAVITILAVLAVVETTYLVMHFVRGAKGDALPAVTGPASSAADRATAAAAADMALAATGPTVAPPAPAPEPRGPADAGARNERDAETTRAPAAPAARPQRAPLEPPADPGWVSLSLPFQVQVFENGAFVGLSDAGRVILSPGAHQLELVNESLQYRGRQLVGIESGKGTALAVTLPTGRLQVNAVPWSEVLIDGERAGETPMGDLQLPIGPHRVTFRHPELGEQVRTAVIAAGASTRLSVDLRK